MQKRSPPKHRHDGTSPLPLGMDWSPPPRKWNGRDTVWPHDPRTGWSYCVTIPSWVILPKSRDSDPVVFYRVHVGLQSPEGVTTTRGVLRRFNDFLKLYSDLKKFFPKKTIPSTPPKGLLRMKSRTLLEERRCSLEEWITKLLSDIDISRSISVASFLELEAAARSSFQDVSENTSESNSAQKSIISSLPAIHGSSSITSDCGSDTAYETSDLGTPRLGRDGSFEVGLEDLSLDEDLTGPIEKLVKYSMSNIDEGLFMGHTILEQLEGLPRSKAQTLHTNSVSGNDLYNGHASKSSSLAGHSGDLFSEQELSKVTGHVRKLSNESIGSDLSSVRGSEMSHPGIPNLSGDGFLDLHGGTESMEILCNSEMHASRGGAQLILPLEQRHKMNRLLLTMQQRLVTTKTDMEDLIARLNQEIAVKEYLATKVKDLEVELETAQQKGRENLQQALSIERERFTQMQWDMEELRQKSLEMELKLKSKSEQDQKLRHESTESSSIQEEDTLMQGLNSSEEQLENVLKRYEELEAKSKADRKVLVKEVKSLRSFQIQLEHELNKSLKEKSEVEELLEQEKQKNEQAETDLKKLLHESKALRNQLWNCNHKFPAMDEEEFDTSPLADASDLLTTSDNHIVKLLEEAELLGQDDRAAAIDGVANERLVAYLELRKVLADTFIDSARLRKQVNSITRHALTKDNTNKDVEGVQKNQIKQG